MAHALVAALSIFAKCFLFDSPRTLYLYGFKLFSRHMMDNGRILTSNRNVLFFTHSQFFIHTLAAAACFVDDSREMYIASDNFCSTHLTVKYFPSIEIDRLDRITCILMIYEHVENKAIIYYIILSQCIFEYQPKTA